MSVGETAYLAFVLGAFVVFMLVLAYATVRTEGAPAWFAAKGDRTTRAAAGPGPAGAARVQ